MKKLTNGLCFKRHTATIILLASIMFIFFTPVISSFEFDNKLFYEKNDMKVEIKDCTLWLGTCLVDGDTLGTVELKSHKTVDEIVSYPVGHQVSAVYYDFESWEFYENGLGDVEFIDGNTGKVIEKDYYFVEWKPRTIQIETYENKCTLLGNGTNECLNVVNGSYPKETGSWVRYDGGLDIPSKSIRIGVLVTIESGDYVDVIWTIAGKKIEKHAFYNEGDYITSIIVSDNNPVGWGVANNGTFVWAGHGGNASIYKWYVNGTYTQEVCSAPATISGLAMYGDYMYSTNDGNNLIYKMHHNCTVHSQWDPGETCGSGCPGWPIVNGTDIWIVDANDRDLLKYDMDGAYQSLTINISDEVDSASGGDIYDGYFYIGDAGATDGVNRLYINGTLDKFYIDASANVSSTAGVSISPNGELIYVMDSGADVHVYAGPDTPSDAGFPVVTLNTPANFTNSSIRDISFNCTAYDNFEVINVSFILDGAINETDASPVNDTQITFEKTLTEGLRFWTCRAADNDSQITTADEWMVNVSYVLPTITLSLPVNDTNATSQSIFFNATIYDDLGIATVEFILDGVVNETNSTITNNTVYRFDKILGDGVHNWTMRATDSYGNTTIAISRFLEVHTTPAAVTINFPRGNIGSFEVGDDLILNWTISELGQNLSAHIKNCSYTYNGVETFLPNISVCVEINSTTFLYVNGVNDLSFKVQDAFDFNTTNTTSWGFSFLETGSNFSSSILETDSDTFTINVSTNETIVSFSAFLNYNGTSSEATSSCTSGDCEIERIIDIPLLNPGQQSENKTFFWRLSIFNGTSTSNINTSTQIQNVSDINFGDCTASVANESVNFTIFNEGNRVPLAVDFEGFFEYYLGSGTVKKESNHTESGETGYQFCIDSDEIFTIDSQITLSQTGFEGRSYSFISEFYTSSDLNKSLFLLNSTGASTIIIEVKDQGLIPQENIIVNISRFYPGIGKFMSVEHKITDEFGQIVASLVQNIVKYRFQFSSLDGTAIKTSEDITVACRAAICIIPFVLEDTTDEFERFDNLTEFSSTGILFDNITNIFTYSWNDQRGESSIIRFEVTRYMFNESGIVCNETSTETLSTLTCSVGSVRASYKAQVFRTVDGLTRRIAILNVKVGDPSQTYGVEGLLWALILLMTCLGIGSFNPTISISLYCVGFIVLGALGIISMPVPVFFANTLLCLLGIWGLNKR